MENFKGFHGISPGDTAYMDRGSFVYFIGRSDDVFKSLDYRISPFEVESEIMEHKAVLEVGVVPTIDDRDRIVPKAFIVLKPDFIPGKQMALELFRIYAIICRPINVRVPLNLWKLSRKPSARK